MRGRPETASSPETPKYITDMVEILAYLTDEELAALTAPRDGLHTVSRYLPTPADVHGFLRERKARLEAVRPAPTTYRKLDADDPTAPWNRETDPERKRRHVEGLLGYQPDRRPTVPKTLTPPTQADLAKLTLKTPSAPPSATLLNLLEEQGYLRPANGESP